MSPVVKRYFDGSPGRELVTCPDCGEDAPKALGGNHGGPDVCARRVTPLGGVRTDMAAGHQRLALLIIRQAAAAHRVFSANNTRALMDEKHIPVAIRVTAFRAAVNAGVMTAIGKEPSDEQGPGRLREVRTYRSEIYGTEVTE